MKDKSYYVNYNQTLEERDQNLFFLEKTNSVSEFIIICQPEVPFLNYQFFPHYTHTYTKLDKAFIILWDWSDSTADWAFALHMLTQF